MAQLYSLAELDLQSLFGLHGTAVLYSLAELDLQSLFGLHGTAVLMG